MTSAANNLDLLPRRAADSHRGTFRPTTTVIFERFRDELGDWRVCVHRPTRHFRRSSSPRALANRAPARERYGMAVQATATNDGMVLRILDTEPEPPSAELLVCRIQRSSSPSSGDEAGSRRPSSQPAGSGRCSLRALLAPVGATRKARSPLWQQRMRSAHQPLHRRRNTLSFRSFWKRCANA